MKNILNLHGFSVEEAQQAIDDAFKWKSFTLADYEKEHDKVVKEIGRITAEIDSDFAAEMLSIIKEHHPELLSIL